MRVIDFYKKDGPVVSLEFFPPRDEEAMAKFNGIIDNLSGTGADYVTVTFGAGGSTRDGSLQAATHLTGDRKLPTVSYIAGFGLGPDDVTKVLDGFKGLGIQTVFVIRGDKPKDGDVTAHPDGFAHASDLIGFIKANYDFTVGCAGYPEGHVEAESLEKDLEYLKLKVDNGAEYVVTQYFYDNDYYFDFVDKCRTKGIKVPIIPGIMPVYTKKLTGILSKVCGSTIPEALQSRLDAVEDGDKEGVLNVGIDYATQQCRGLLKKGVPGLHFYTMNRSKSTSEIIGRLKEEKLL